MNSFFDLINFLEYNHSSLLGIPPVLSTEESQESEATGTDDSQESAMRFTELFPQMLTASDQLLVRKDFLFFLETVRKLLH